MWAAMSPASELLRNAGIYGLAAAASLLLAYFLKNDTADSLRGYRIGAAIAAVGGLAYAASLVLRAVLLVVT